MAVLNSLAKAARGGFMDWRRGVSPADCIGEMHDCEAAMQKATRYLEALIDDRMVAERKIASLARVIRKHESAIAELLESDDHAQALSVAEEILEHEAQRERLRQLHQGIMRMEQIISRNLYEDVQIMKRLRHTLVAYSQSGQVAGRSDAAALLELRDIRQTLARIRSNQQWSASMLATRERLHEELQPGKPGASRHLPIRREELDQVLRRVVRHHVILKA